MVVDSVSLSEACHLCKAFLRCPSTFYGEDTPYRVFSEFVLECLICWDIYRPDTPFYTINKECGWFPNYADLPRQSAVVCHKCVNLPGELVLCLDRPKPEIPLRGLVTPASAVLKAVRKCSIQKSPPRGPLRHFQVKCLFDGCHERGNVGGEIENHEKICFHKCITCGDCGKSVLVEDMAAHMASHGLYDGRRELGGVFWQKRFRRNVSKFQRSLDSCKYSFLPLPNKIYSTSLI